MSSPEQARQALIKIARLSDAHGRALTKAFRLLGEGALQGPGARTLHDGLAQRHRTVQKAFNAAYEQVERLAARPSPSQHIPRCGPAIPVIRDCGTPPPPSSPRPAPGPAQPGPFIPRCGPVTAAPPLPAPAVCAPDAARSGKPDELSALAREVSRVGQGWQEAGGELARILMRLGLEPAHGRTIGTAGEWVAGRRREIYDRHSQLTRKIGPGHTTRPGATPDNGASR